MISGKWSVKRKTGINAEAAEDTEFTEAEPKAASKRLYPESREESWLVKTPIPHLVGFLTQSAETLENKRVEFLMIAKKCRRVRKNMKRKEIGYREWGIGQV